MSDRGPKLSDEFPAIGPDPDLKWLARAMSAMYRSQVRVEEHAETQAIASSNLADRVGRLEVASVDTIARVDHIERSLAVPPEGRRRRPLRWLMRLPAGGLAALIFLLGAGVLALAVALLFKTRSS